MCMFRCVKDDMDNQQHWDAIVKVTTITEVMNLCNIKYRTTVIDWIDRGEIIGTKVGGGYILSLDSVVEWLGKPRKIS